MSIPSAVFQQGVFSLTRVSYNYDTFDLCLFDNIMLSYIDGYELLEYAKTLDISVIFAM